MDYKITRAIENPAIERENLPAHLHIEIEIEGFKWIMGGLPVAWVLQDVKDYIEANYDDILRQAKLRAKGENPKIREDLLDGDYIPVLTEKKIKDIEKRVKKLEDKVG